MPIQQDELAEMDIAELYSTKRNLDYEIWRYTTTRREADEGRKAAEEKRLAVIMELMRRAESNGGE